MTNYDQEYFKGLDWIVEEQMRQNNELGYTIQHDGEEHSPEELMRVGACYIEFAANDMEGMDQDNPHPFWPDTSIPWKPEPSTIKNAVKGAAFVAASLDLMNAKMMGTDRG